MKPRYEVRFTHQALKDLGKLTPKLKEKIRKFCLEILQNNPYEGKRLVGELRGSYSLRLSYQDRLVYSIAEREKVVYVERCRTHYGE